MPLALSFPISFDRPAWLWLLLAIPVLAGVSMRTLRALEPRRRMLAILFRSLVIATLAVALARVQYVKRNEHVAVLFVLDRSRSIPEELRLKAQEYIKQTVKEAQNKDHEAHFGVVSFDGDADVDVVPSRVGATILEFGSAVEPNRTNIAAGVRMALAAFPEGYARRLVLITDGNQNEGDLAGEVEAAAANGVAVDVLPLQFEHRNEILFDRISVPTQVQKETRIPVRLIVKSTQKTKARLTLYHNDQEVPLSEESRILDLSGGMRPDRFDVSVELHDLNQEEGTHRFDARLTPLTQSADSVVENNQATAFTFAQNPQGVLILTMPGSEDEAVLRDALLREMGAAGKNVPVTVHSIDQYRDLLTLERLRNFGTVMISNIPADEFNETQHQLLAAYVRDAGHGLIMIGGDNGFGAGGWIGKPIEEVSPVSFEIKQEKKMPRGALVIVMHSCEIARGNYWGQQVAIASVNTISSLDYLGVISYSYNPGGPWWDVPLAPATDKRDIIRRVTQMQNGDMPDFDSIMKQAVSALLKLRDASQKHVIVISDGDPQPPTPETIKMMVDNKITCSTVGIGYGAHVVEKTLRDMANQTHPPGEFDKHFYRCTNPNMLPQIFVKEAKIVRRSLIQDAPFSPRLIMPFDQTVSGLSTSGLPSLGGLVLTTPKPDSVMPIVRSSDKGNDPVLAYWNIGAGKMAVFTSGYWRKWGADWSRWDRFGKFWAQLVRWSMGESSPASFDVITRQDGSKGKISFEAIDKDASYLTNLQIKNATIVTPEGQSKPLFVTQVGPGQYEASFDVNDTGSYLGFINYHYVDSSEGDPKVRSGRISTGLSVSYSPEFREMKTNHTLLSAIVQKSNGKLLAMDPKADDVFGRKPPPSVSRQPIWRWVVQWLLLPLFLLDVAGRRLASTLAMSLYVEVAVFVTLCATLHTGGAPAWSYALALIAAEAVGWSIRWRYILPTIQYFTYGVTTLARAGQRSTQSLSQLKNVREKVRGGMQSADEPPVIPRKRETGPIPLEPAADRRRRFDVGDAAAARPVKDLTETVGGAKAETPQERRPGQGPGSPGDLTSRLLKAKQRAQEEIKKERGEDQQK